MQTDKDTVSVTEDSDMSVQTVVDLTTAFDKMDGYTGAYQTGRIKTDRDTDRQSDNTDSI